MQTLHQHTFLLFNKSLKSLKFLSESISIRPLDIIPITAFMKDNKRCLIVATAMDQLYKFNCSYIHYIYSDFINKQKFLLLLDMMRNLKKLLHIIYTKKNLSKCYSP